MKDSLDSLLTTLRERVTNPFIGSFILSWLLWNWKFAFLFFSSDYTTNIKIHMLDTDYIHILNMTLWPFLTALVLIIGMPYFYWVIEKLQNHAKLGRYQRNKKYLEDRTKELEDSADTAELAAMAQVRLDAANVSLTKKPNLSKTNSEKNIYIVKQFEEGPFSLDTTKNGAAIHFQRPVKNIFFKVQTHSNNTANFRSENFLIYNGTVAGETVFKFTLNRIRELEPVKFKLDEPTNKITIKSKADWVDEIELFNITTS